MAAARTLHGFGTAAALVAVLSVIGRDAAAQAKTTGRSARAPTGITVSGAAGAVTVAWTTLGPGTQYLVLRAPNVVAAATELGRASTTSFVDTTARASRTWFYFVVALRPDGARDTSAVVAYTVPAPSPSTQKPPPLELRPAPATENPDKTAP